MLRYLPELKNKENNDKPIEILSIHRSETSNTFFISLTCNDMKIKTNKESKKIEQKDFIIITEFIFSG